GRGVLGGGIAGLGVDRVGEVRRVYGQAAGRNACDDLTPDGAAALARRVLRRVEAVVAFLDVRAGRRVEVRGVDVGLPAVVLPDLPGRLVRAAGVTRLRGRVARLVARRDGGVGAGDVCRR